MGSVGVGVAQAWYVISPGCSCCVLVEERQGTDRSTTDCINTDILIIGTGPSVLPLAPAVRTYLNGLGIRLEVQDTRNASAQFNLLATERGVGQVAAALIPTGWREGVGIVSDE